MDDLIFKNAINARKGRSSIRICYLIELTRLLPKELKKSSKTFRENALFNGVISPMRLAAIPAFSKDNNIVSTVQVVIMMGVSEYILKSYAIARSRAIEWW